MTIPRTSWIACLGVLAAVATVAPSKAQAQCGDGGYYQPAPTYYAPQTYYAPPTYYAPQTYYAPRAPVVYYDSPRVYRSYSVGVSVGHGQYYRGHRDYGRDYGHRQVYPHSSPRYGRGHR